MTYKYLQAIYTTFSRENVVNPPLELPLSLYLLNKNQRFQELKIMPVTSNFLLWKILLKVLARN